jgi:O-antigen/teichoic acid export membrane protein
VQKHGTVCTASGTFACTANSFSVVEGGDGPHRVSRNAIEFRAGRLSLVAGLSTVLGIAFQLLSVPICLKYWGSDTYGAWLALFSAFLMIRSLDGGFVAYVGNKLNYLYHQDAAALRTHLASGLLGTTLIASVQLSLCIASMFTNSIVSAGTTAGSQMDHGGALGLAVLIGTWTFSGSYLGIVHRLLVPTGYMYQAAWWSIAFQASQFGTLVFAAVLQLNLLQASISFALVQLLVYGASGVYMYRKLPNYFPWWSGASLSTAIHDLVRSLALTATNFVQQGTMSGLVIVVAALSGPASVPVFTTMRTLANLWTNVTQVVTSPLLPEVVRYHALGEGWKLCALAKVYWAIPAAVVNLAVLISYSFLPDLYATWTSSALAFDRPLLCALLASVVLSNASGLIALYLNGINCLGVLLLSAVGRCVIALLLGVFLSGRFGLAGFGFALLIGELFASLAMAARFVYLELPRHGSRLPLGALAPIIVSSLAAVIFFMSEAIDEEAGGSIYMYAVFADAAAIAWGWKTIEHDVRTRIFKTIVQPFSRKGKLRM